MITLEHVEFCYEDGKKVLSDLNYTFEMGNCYCLQGPNGSGKSTLFRILNGLSFPTKGRFLFEGEEITAKKMKNPDFMNRFHKNIGYIFQNSEIQLFTKSVEDEVAFGLYQLGLSEVEVRQKTEQYIHLLGLEEMRDRTPYTLSGGEKKRTALAAVLAMEPRVLILDEPISGLDEEGQEWITRFIASQKSPERMMIIATHNHLFADRLADKKIGMTKEHRLYEMTAEK